MKSLHFIEKVSITGNLLRIFQYQNKGKNKLRILDSKSSKNFKNKMGI